MPGARSRQSHHRNGPETGTTPGKPERRSGVKTGIGESALVPAQRGRALLGPSHLIRTMKRAIRMRRTTPEPRTIAGNGAFLPRRRPRTEPGALNPYALTDVDGTTCTEPPRSWTSVCPRALGQRGAAGSLPPPPWLRTVVNRSWFHPRSTRRGGYPPPRGEEVSAAYCGTRTTAW